nr:hypothetical protein [Clostridia bacterium]
MNSVDVLLALCKHRKIAVSRVERDLKYGNGYFKSLKKKEIPGNRLSEVAEYFGVTMDYLLGATPESYLLGTEYQLKEAEKAYGKETDPDKRDELGGLIDVLRDSLYDLRLATEADKKNPATQKSDGDLSGEDDELKEMIKAWKSLSPSARAHAKAVIKALESSDDSEA